MTVVEEAKHKRRRKSGGDSDPDEFKTSARLNESAGPLYDVASNPELG
jgi:hypothetical protein